MLRMGAVTVRLSATLTVCPALSVTWKPRQPNVPAAVGVPLNWPPLNAIPLGSEPAVCVHVQGGVPPENVHRTEWAVST
jgi:hypothetical protein